jgi:type II secretory pathway predicted ATPase ExeA
MASPSQKTRPDATDLRAHFGLRSLPLTRELAIAHRWPLPQHEAAIDALRATVEDRMSAALIAPAGTGKTLVLRALAESLPEARYRVHYLHVTSLSKRDFCRYLASAIGAPPAGHTGALIAAIQQRATTLMDADAVRPVLLLDEAHEMRPDVLALLRLLTNFQLDSRLVLSIVIVGQPALRELLRRDELADVRGRMAHVATLRTLSREESHAYIAHRLAVAGATRELFDSAALDAIFEVAQGNLRALDTIGRKTLYQAAAEGADVCGFQHVLAARALIAA